MAATVVKRAVPKPAAPGTSGAPARPAYVPAARFKKVRPPKPGPITSDPSKCENVDGVWIEFHPETNEQRCVSKCHSTGVQCRRFSEHGSDHCKYHGGKNVNRATNASRYHKMHPTLAARVQTHLTDPNWRDMRVEVGLIREMIHNKLEAESIGAVDEETISNRMELLRKMMATIAQVEGEMKVTLSIGQVQAFAEQLLRLVVDAATALIKDEGLRTQVCELIAKGIDQLMTVGAENTQ